MSNLITKLNKRHELRKNSQTDRTLIGWFLADDQHGVIYYPPERVKSAPAENVHAKSAALCPATIAMDAQNFEVKCPVDINLAFVRGEKNIPALRNLSGNQSTIRNNKLNSMITLVSESEWRYKDRPIIQLILPYVFLADTPVYINQTSAFMHYYKTPLPGTTFCGRFPIDVWPRQLMWAFEWHDVSKPLEISRGTPLFYVNFETGNPAQAIRLIEAEKTPELQDYLKLTGGVTNYVNQTFSLFKRARELRPKKLLEPKKK